jgi:hypothetical protein
MWYKLRPLLLGTYWQREETKLGFGWKQVVKLKEPEVTLDLCPFRLLPLAPQTFGLCASVWL